MDTRRLFGQAMACSLLAFGAAVALSSSASATVTFGSVETYVDSEASVIATGASGYVGPTAYTGYGYASATTLPTTPVTVLSFSQANAYSPKMTPHVQASATDSETTQANFFDATSGTVEFDGSSTAKVITPGAGAFAQSNLGYFVYDFTVDTESSVTISYDVTANGDYTSFFPGYTAYVYQGVQPNILEGTAALNSAGTFATVIGPGAYSLEIDNSIGNDYSSSIAGLSSASSVADFGFQISAVPEPATWGMMLVGFGALGFAMRSGRRQRMAATA
jgi:hypothetical protein